MTINDRSIQYTQQIIGWQPRLYAFVLSLTGNTDEADEILQNANVALLQKESAFRQDADFGAWAMQIAYYEVQRHRNSNSRARRRFDDALLDQLAAPSPDSTVEPEKELQLLRKCMQRLSQAERQMLAFRYGGKTLRIIAEKLGSTVGSVSQTLYRTRAKLAECMKRSLRAERHDEL